MSNVKLSQIVSGGAFASGTDTVVTVRNGNTDVLTTIGAIATAAVDGTTLVDNSNTISLNLANPNTWTAQQTHQINSLGTSPTDAILILNSTSAASNAQQYSPAFELEGQGYATTPAASQSVNFRYFGVPVQGAANPSGNFILQSNINGAGYVNQVMFQSDSSIISGPSSATLSLQGGGFFASNSARLYTVGLAMRSNFVIFWSNGSAWNNTADTGIARNGAGIVEINNGTAGTFAQLKCSKLTTSAGIYQSAGAAEEAVYSNGNSGTSLALNMDNGNLQSVTITGAVTITLATPTNPGKFMLIVTQDGTGHTYSFSGVKWAAATQPTWSTAANAKDVVSFAYDGTNWYGSGGVGFA